MRSHKNSCSHNLYMNVYNRLLSLLAALHSLWDPNSQTRYWTCALGGEGTSLSPGQSAHVCTWGRGELRMTGLWMREARGWMLVSYLFLWDLSNTEKVLYKCPFSFQNAPKALSRNTLHDFMPYKKWWLLLIKYYQAHCLPSIVK